MMFMKKLNSYEVKDYWRNEILTSFVASHICSAENWRYAAKQFVKAYPREVIVHCELCDLRFRSLLVIL